MAQDRLLEIRGGVFGYHKPIVEIENFSVSRGEIVSIVGQSGVGKSTLFKAISGLINPLHGKLLFEDTERSGDWRRQNVRLILQHFPLFHWLTVEENLRLSAKIMGIWLEEKELHQILEDLSARHLAKKYPRELSGGEKCRASLAQASISSPHLLLLDEPFSGLDIVVKDSVAKEIFSFVQKNNAPIVYITHDLYDACAYANRVAVIAGHPVASIKDVIEAKNVETTIGEVRRLLQKYA